MDLDLPVPDVPLPAFHDLPLAWVYALNTQFCEGMIYDDAYFARSLAAKNDVPFVM